jgi:pimeloyl-ACP methyl ester carboxylesterase
LVQVLPWQAIEPYRQITWEESTVHRREIETIAIIVLALTAEPAFAISPPSEPDSSSSAAPCSCAETKLADTRAETRVEPFELEFLHPYERGKVPVVLVHGLWGSPRQWERMLQALDADPFLREHFQFLTFGYSTNAPIPYSASLLRRGLRRLKDRFEPGRSDPAWDRMILIGHSMGGLLCKMMTQESGTKLWDLVTDHSIEKLAGPQEARELLQSEMIFEPLPEVRRLIFIATPHRGSRFDWEPMRGVTNVLVRPHAPLQQAYASLLASNSPNVFTPTFRAGLPTSLDELSWEHPLLLAIDGLPFNASVKRHSIIADLRKTTRPGGGDGLVSYASAHHPGADSELLVNAGHCCLDNIDVIGEVARILREHVTPRSRPTYSPVSVQKKPSLPASESKVTTSAIEPRLPNLPNPGTGPWDGGGKQSSFHD